MPGNAVWASAVLCLQWAGGCRHDSPTSSVSSLHSVGGPSALVTAVLKPTAPSLTPSLANYYNEALIGHVTGWQADHAERQVGSFSAAFVGVHPRLLHRSSSNTCAKLAKLLVLFQIQKRFLFFFFFY